MRHTGLSEILNHNDQLTLLVWAVMYVYINLQTRWHIRCHR